MKSSNEVVVDKNSNMQLFMGVEIKLTVEANNKNLDIINKKLNEVIKSIYQVKMVQEVKVVEICGTAVHDECESHSYKFETDQYGD